MSLLFNRYCRLDIKSQTGEFQDISIKPDKLNRIFRIQFNVNATYDFAFYRAEIKIYNLPKNIRKKFIWNRLGDDFGLGPLVTLTAGYKAKSGIIFDGAIQSSHTERDVKTGDFITVLNCGIPLSNKKINIQAYPKASIQNNLYPAIFSIIKKAISQPPKKEISLANGFDGTLANSLSGVVLSSDLKLSGNTFTILKKLEQKFGLIFYIDNGRLNVIKKSVNSNPPIVGGSTIPVFTFKEEKSSNILIESPFYTEIGADFTTLLKPELSIFQFVRVESELITKNVSINSLNFIGDTYGNEWFSKVTGVNFNQIQDA